MFSGESSVYRYHRPYEIQQFNAGLISRLIPLVILLIASSKQALFFRRKSNTVNIIKCGLIPRDECWSINRLFISRVNDILKYECHKNGFVFIVQDHSWTLLNGSLDCSLFFKDSLHLVEQGNVKLAKSSVNVNCTEQSNARSKVVTHYVVMFLNNPFQLLFLIPLRRMIFLH